MFTRSSSCCLVRRLRHCINMGDEGRRRRLLVNMLWLRFLSGIHWHFKGFDFGQNVLKSSKFCPQDILTARSRLLGSFIDFSCSSISVWTKTCLRFSIVYHYFCLHSRLPRQQLFCRDRHRNTAGRQNPRVNLKWRAWPIFCSFTSRDNKAKHNQVFYFIVTSP